MARTLLWKIKLNKYANHSFFRPFLYVYEDMMVYSKRRRLLFHDEITIPFTQISRVNKHKGVILTRLEFIMSGGEDPVVIRGLWNRPAKKLKQLVDDKIYHVNAKHGHHTTSMAEHHKSVHNVDQALLRLRELRNRGALSKKDYEKKKKELLKDLY